METIKTANNVTNLKDKFKLVPKGKKLNAVAIEIAAIKKFTRQEYRKELAKQLNVTTATISNAFLGKAHYTLYQISLLLKNSN